MNSPTLSRASCLAVFTSSIILVAAPLDGQESPPPLVPRGSEWKLHDDGSDPGPNWFQPAYNDSAWPAGAAQLGFGDGDETTLLNRGHVAYYFRRSFSVGEALSVGSLKLRTLFDDGVVVYLNGVEVFRALMPPGAITQNTLATSVRSDENEFVETVVPPNLLLDGVNVLAAEVHQASLSSSDVGFDLELAANSGPPPPPVNRAPVAASANVITNQDVAVSILLAASDSDNDPLTLSIVMPPTHGTLAGTPPQLVYTPEAGFSGADSFTFKANDGQADSAPATVSITVHSANEPDNLLVAAGSEWKWLYPEAAPPGAWNQRGFDDGLWPGGPAELGYGEDDEATPITDAPIGTAKPLTAYFRHYFQVDDPEVIGGLILRTLFDDGVIVHLNGIEIFRGNMPAGPVSHQTTALLAVQEPIPFVQADVPSGVLLPGINLLAVECFISKDNRTATISLDGSASTDADGDALSFSWVDNNDHVIASTPTASVTLRPGIHRFTLDVTGTSLNGQSATSSQEFDLKVVTAGTAVRTIVDHVSVSLLRKNTKRQLARSLTSALENFNRGRFSNGVRHLRVFETQVRAQVRPVYATLATELRNAAREIIEAVSSAPAPLSRKRK